MDGEGHIDEIRVLIIYVRTDEVLRIFLLCHPFLMDYIQFTNQTVTGILQLWDPAFAVFLLYLL